MRYTESACNEAFKTNKKCVPTTENGIRNTCAEEVYENQDFILFVRMR